MTASANLLLYDRRERTYVVLISPLSHQLHIPSYFLWKEITNLPWFTFNLMETVKFHFSIKKISDILSTDEYVDNIVCVYRQ